MTDSLEDHEGPVSIVSIGGRTITNLRFADNIDTLAGKKEEHNQVSQPTGRGINNIMA